MTHPQRVVELLLDLNSQLPWKRGRFTLHQLDGRASRRRFNTKLYQAHIFDSWSSSKPCGSRERCGERLSNAAAQLSILGFSPVHSASPFQTPRIVTFHPNQILLLLLNQSRTRYLFSLRYQAHTSITSKMWRRVSNTRPRPKAQHVTVQVQEVESIQISVEKASTYRVLQCVQPGAWNMAMLHHPDGLSTAMDIPSHSWIWQPAMEIGTSR